MKKALFLVLKNSSKAADALEALKESGYNGTIVNTESLHHAIEYSPEDHHFFSLRHLDAQDKNESVFCVFIIDNDKLEDLKENIRQHTDNFNAVKGFMYSVDASDYEGSI